MTTTILAAMRRYAFGFVNAHDSDVCRQIMRDDYQLHMGSDDLVGRDDHYIPAVEFQMTQFPDLMFTVHDLLTDGTHAALLFSEHGTSARDPHARASWLGVSIYRYDGDRLAECWVEQDHYGRRRQIETGVTAPVPPVAVAAFSMDRNRPMAGADTVVREWLRDLDSWPPADATLDRGPFGDDQLAIDLEPPTAEVVVSEGDRVAFHATLRGRYRGGLTGFDDHIGEQIQTYVGAYARIADGKIVDVDAVTNRLVVQRQFRRSR